MSVFEEMLAKVRAQQIVPTVNEMSNDMNLPPNLSENKQDSQKHGGQDSIVAASTSDSGRPLNEKQDGQTEENSDSVVFPKPFPSLASVDHSGHEGEQHSAKPPEESIAHTGKGQLDFASGVAFGHNVEEMVVKRFPKSLVESLRLLLGTQIGHPFARECSAPQLLTAFVLAQLGTEIEGLDKNTSEAVAAFQAMNPRLGAIENGVTGLNQQAYRATERLTNIASQIENLERVVNAMELGHAYMLADRLVTLPTHGMTEKTAEIDHPKALTMRGTLRRQAEAQRKLQQQRDGRPY